MELWKTIEETTNYEISNLGRVKNSKTGQILDPEVGGNGYKQVSLKFKDTQKFKKQYIHRLVAQYWLVNPNPEARMEVNHKNLDRTDNRAENLEWVTPSENQKHRLQNGNRKTSNRRVAQMDLDGNIIQIFDSIIEAANSLGVCRQGIDKVVHGQQGRITAHGYRWKILN